MKGSGAVGSDGRKGADTGLHSLGVGDAGRAWERRCRVAWSEHGVGDASGCRRPLIHTTVAVREAQGKQPWWNPTGAPRKAQRDHRMGGVGSQHLGLRQLPRTAQGAPNT